MQIATRQAHAGCGARTVATFFVVSFSDRVMSSSRISWGFFMSSLFFSSFARLAAVRFFCSMERGPSLNTFKT